MANPINKYLGKGSATIINKSTGDTSLGEGSLDATYKPPKTVTPKIIDYIGDTSSGEGSLVIPNNQSSTPITNEPKPTSIPKGVTPEGVEEPSSPPSNGGQSGGAQPGEGQSVTDILQTTYGANADKQANLLYNKSKASAEMEYSTKATELAASKASNQEALEMTPYSNQQTTDKLGWTGGYVLDQQKQLEVLKAGIQAQLFNQQELNKYGLESQLAAARLDADLKREELAYQYYKDAEELQINKAVTTGYYMPAEAADYLTQQKVAQLEMDKYSDNPESAEYKRAKEVVDYVTNYFGKLGLTEQGIKTLALISYEQDLELDTAYKRASILSAIYGEDGLTKKYDNGQLGIVNDANGEAAFNEGTFSLKTLDYTQDVSNKELYEILSTGTNNHIATGLISYKLQHFIQTFKETNKPITTENINAFAQTPVGSALIKEFNEMFGSPNSYYYINKNKYGILDKRIVFEGADKNKYAIDANFNIYKISQDAEPEIVVAGSIIQRFGDATVEVN